MKIFIANWKMQLLPTEAVKLAKEMVKKLKDAPHEAEIVLAPSHDALSSVAQVIRGSSLLFGAQDCFWEARGAFTGEVSTESLRELGVKYILLGHSERRQYLGETDEMVAKKLRSALRAGLTPVLCVGETIEERESGKTEAVLTRQVSAALSGLDLQKQELVIAYEPVWAIGTGRAAQGDDISGAHKFIRGLISEFLGKEGRRARIIYGGSVDEKNIGEIMELPDVAGALVGGASLKPDIFKTIVNSK